MLQPSIVKKAAFTVVGFEAAFIHALSPDANNLEVIGTLWEKFGRDAEKIPSRLGDESYGVIHGRPEAERKHPDELQYIAGAAVSKIEALPPGMTSLTIPAGTFAVFTHHGPISAIGKTCEEIYRVWLPQSGYKHSGFADVELYDHRFCTEEPDSEMEYWVPIIPV